MSTSIGSIGSLVGGVLAGGEDMRSLGGAEEVKEGLSMRFDAGVLVPVGLEEIIMFFNAFDADFVDSAF